MLPSNLAGLFSTSSTNRGGRTRLPKFGRSVRGEISLSARRGWLTGHLQPPFPRFAIFDPKVRFMNCISLLVGNETDSRQRWTTFYDYVGASCLTVISAKMKSGS